MSTRGFIIGIPNYPLSGDLAKQIASATRSAEAFYAWLIGPKQAKPADIVVCTDGGTFPNAGRTYGTKREEIVDAMAALVEDGQDQTTELYVFYSGHGFCYRQTQDERALDILIGSDFVSAGDSGRCCIKLVDVQAKLFSILGGRHHYYFLDACRTFITDEEIEPIPLGRKFGRPAQRGKPEEYTLFSTSLGAAANIDSTFAPALVDGLHGKGGAKGPAPDGRLFVQFRLLCKYVRDHLLGQKPEQSGDGEGYILEITPIPTYKCKVTVQGASATDQFTVRLFPPGQPDFARTTTCTGPQFEVEYNPGNFILDVRKGEESLTRVAPPAKQSLDFFEESCSAEFALAGDLADSFSLESIPPTVAFFAPPHTNIAALNFNTRVTSTLPHNFRGALDPGEYEFTLLENGSPVSRILKDVPADALARVDFTRPMDPVRGSIVRTIGGSLSDGVVDFSESLRGPIANRDLSLWLTLMGASRLWAPHGTFSKLSRLALDDFSSMAPGESRVYALAAFENEADLRIGCNGVWETPRLIDGLTGVYQANSVVPAGSTLVSFQMGSFEPRTYSAFAIPNRVTFFVFAEGDKGRLKVHQFIMPVYHLMENLDPVVQVKLRDGGMPVPPLQITRSAHAIQSKFSQGRVIAPPSYEESRTWHELLMGKWLDPVMSLIACYEILRRGDDGRKKTLIDEVIPNLERYFPGIPDTACIAEMLGASRPMPVDPPLFTEGLAAFPDLEDSLRPSARYLDYGSVWTSWVRAVPPPLR